jgi:hypothetical protein
VPLNTKPRSPLQVVKVYVSIYSDNFGKKRAMSNLRRLEPYVRREMGQRVPLRLTPEYRFEYDDSVDEADLVGVWVGGGWGLRSGTRVRRILSSAGGWMNEGGGLRCELGFQG